MALKSVFKNPVNKTVDSLIKHLDALASEDEDKKQKAIGKLSEDISNVHFILYGDSEKDPDPTNITKLVPRLIKTDDGDLFCRLAQYTTAFEFEAKKQTASIMNYIIRRCGKYKADQYIKDKTDKNGHNVIIDCLLRGYHDQHLAQNVGSVLQEMAKRQELAPMLLNRIRITRKKVKQPSKDKDKDGAKEQKEQPVVNGGDDEYEERQVIDELFVLVQKPSFDIASDAYKTLQLLLTRNKKLVPKYLETNYDKFFGEFNQLIQSDNYVTQRQFLTLLSELLLEKTNFNLMIKYIGQKENLKIAMTLLKNDSNAISHEAFHIFKVFVANPKKARDIHIVLWKNREKLVTFLENFLSDKAKEDESFAEEKKIVIKHLQDLPEPEEIRKHKEKKRAQSLKQTTQQQPLNGNNAKNKNANMNRAKSQYAVPDMSNNDNDDNNQILKPPVTANNGNDNDNNNNNNDNNDSQPSNQ